MNEKVMQVLKEMRERLVNNKKNTSPTLIDWADRIEKALKEEDEKREDS